MVSIIKSSNRFRRISIWSLILFGYFIHDLCTTITTTSLTGVVASLPSSMTATTTLMYDPPSRHTPRRQLEEANNVVNDDTFPYNDLSTYSIRYEKCQFVKMYDDDLASNQDGGGVSSSSSPLATKHFVVYRLCPSDMCTDSSSSSNSNTCGGTDPNVPYGTYTMTVEEYLYYTINYQKQVLEESCNFCNAYCVSTSSSSSSSSSPYCTTDCTNTMCNSCSTTCDEYQTFNTAIANGAANIADAANFIQCQKLENNNVADDEGEAQQEGDGGDDSDDSAVQYYIGPYCQSVRTTSTDTAQTSISIGLFADENCYSPVTNVNMTEILGGIQLSYHLFKHTTTTTTTTKKNPMQCLSCLESNNNNNNNNNNDANDADNVNEMCENLYTISAKCESTTGLQNGFIQMHRNNNNNNNQDDESSRSNQVENEFMVCTFIQSLLYNSYTETGVINIRITQDYIIRTMTYRQRNTLIGLMVLIVTILGAIYYYHHKIQQLIHASMLTTETTTTPTSIRDKKKTLLIRAGEMS